MISKSYRIMYVVNGDAKEYSQELTREVARLVKRLVKKRTATKVWIEQLIYLDGDLNRIWIVR